MYIFYICILVPLLQTSFSLNEEEIDLNLLSSNYDGVDTIGENAESIEPDESGIVIFDTISAPLLEKLCKNSNTLIYITQEDITIDCEAFNKGDQPVEQTHDIIKRSADLEEGSGMPDSEETTIQPEEETTLTEEETTIQAEGGMSDTEETTIQPEEETTTLTEEETTIQAEGEATTFPEEETTIKPEEEEEATTLPAEEETTILPDEVATLPKEKEEATTLAQEEEKATTIPKQDEEGTTLAKEENEIKSEHEEATALLNEESETTVSPEEVTTIQARRKYALAVEGVALKATNDTETDQNAKEEITTPKEENAEANAQDEKEVVTTTMQPIIPEEENKAKPDMNEEDNKDDSPPSEDEQPKEGDNHEPNEDAEVVNNRAVTSLHKNQEHKEAPNDEPDIAPPKESTENTKKAGSKDTTILIILFAAVVVVGALAFGYNYVKKRRQQSADLERVERGSTLKRSLQNLTKPEGAEPERKPLIGDSKEVEMVDMKKVSLVENSEKPSNEQVVKT